MVLSIEFCIFVQEMIHAKALRLRQEKQKRECHISILKTILTSMLTFCRPKDLVILYAKKLCGSFAAPQPFGVAQDMLCVDVCPFTRLRRPMNSNKKR